MEKIGETMKTFIAKNTLVSFYLLGVVITSVAVLPIILSIQGIISLDVSPEWHPLGALGPILAACLVAYFSRGKLGLSNYIKSLRDTRFSLKLFLFSISPLLVYPVIAVAVPLFSKQTGQSLSRFSPVWWVSLLISSLAYGIGEEAGWRGFALPRLQARMNALSSIFVLTIFHALWHIPFFFYRLQFGFGATIGFFIGMLAGGIIMTHLVNESGGKTLLPILFHTTWNIVSMVSLATFPEVTYAITTLQMIAAVTIVIVFRPKNLATRARFSVNDLAQ
jgi:membrane protease YdiL (CAAX protease family)